MTGSRQIRARHIAAVLTGAAGLLVALPLLADELPAVDLYPAFSGKCEACTEPGSAPTNQPFDIETTLGLRGRFDHSDGAGRFTALIVPGFSASYNGFGASTRFSASAGIARSGNEASVDSVSLEAGGSRQLGHGQTIEGSLALDISQVEPFDPGLPDTASGTPLAGTATLSASYARQFGRFGVEAGITAGREAQTDTPLEGGGSESNADTNRTFAGLDLRAGMRLGTHTSVFADLSAEADAYDAPSAGLGVKTDGVRSGVALGLAYERGSVFSAEGSLGLTNRNYTDQTLDDALTYSADGSLTFAPGRGVQLSAGLSTDVAPTTRTGATTEVSRSLDLGIELVASDTLRLRADSGLSHVEYLGIADTRSDVFVGGGFDYDINRFVALSADYRYTTSNDSVDGRTERHRLGAGITISR